MSFSFIIIFPFFFSQSVFLFLASKYVNARKHFVCQTPPTCLWLDKQIVPPHNSHQWLSQCCCTGSLHIRKHFNKKRINLLTSHLKRCLQNNVRCEVKGTHLTFPAFPASNWPCPTFTFIKPGEVWHLPLCKHTTPFKMQQLSKIYMPYANQFHKLASLECKCSDSKIPATYHSLYLLFEQT